MESLLKGISREGFPTQFWMLVRLRYRMIWAHMRTGSGKMTLLFAVYLLLGLLAIIFLLGGLGTAVAAIEVGQGEPIARLMLAGLFVNGIGLSLLFGVGPRAAFTEDSLRRYPLDRQERFVIRHVIGLLDPTWLLLVAGVFGVAVGFVWLGAGAILTALPAVLLFITANYLVTMLLLTLVEMMMQTRRGAAWLGGLVLLAVSFGPLLVASLAATRRSTLLLVLDYLLWLTPPGAAAVMVAGDGLIEIAGGASLLLIWCSGLGWILLKLESRPKVAQTAAAGTMEWNDLYDQFGNLFGVRYGPLVSKSLRYHLRCNLIRFSLLTSPIIVLMGKFIFPGQSRKSFFIISIAIFFIMSAAAGAALMLNLFGFDEAGIRRYAVLPIAFGDALRAGALASLALRLVTVCVAFTLWLMFYNNQTLSWRMFVVIACVSLASLFLFNALGIWTSLLSPKNADFDAIWNNRLSFGGNVVVIGGILIPFWAMMAFMDRIGEDALLRFWWMPSIPLLLCLGFFGLTMIIIDAPLTGRREKLVNLIAGARDR
ncbi:MAG: hypothetical protein IPM66_17645 [Acidobacteriota bacterium]|nr:MAG: hypothetical protein IPM66_17645 [Acidobacteriota bacterium]